MSIGERVVRVADSLMYIREATNSNDHPMIDRMLAFLGLPKGLSWCLAFCLWCWHQAVEPLPFPRIARCSTFWEQVRHQPWRYNTFTADDVLWGLETVQPGDIGICSVNRERSNWNGHAFIAVKQLSRKSFATAEGNTQPGPGGNQREGGGVYYRTRYVGMKGLYLEGFVRPRRISQ